MAAKTTGKIAYIDLFAGPGRYDDGNKSTPLLVLEKAIEDINMRQRLVAIFNDKRADFMQLLQTEISKLPNVAMLANFPQVSTHEVGDPIVEMFNKMRLVPTLLFLDPWGYKGLSLELVNSVVKDWACECIFFFNYNRINAGLPNKTVQGHMDGLFGKVRADALRARLTTLKSAKRELVIIEEVVEALKETHGKYVMPFCFKNKKGTRTGHYLIFVSKHFKGYDIMKGIMAGESSTTDQGVPSFEYNPARAIKRPLEGMIRPLDDLEQVLPIIFAGRTLTVQEVYEKHSVGTRYIMRNYKDVLLKLESDGRIQTDPPSDDRRKGTIRDNVRITFPTMGG